MRQITIAFDVDGTLISKKSTPDLIIANERIRSLLVILAHMKNVKIIVWSGSGELWARQASRAIGIDKYVNQYASKSVIGYDSEGKPIFDPAISPDIAVDDVEACILGNVNLIVREQ